MQTFLIISLVFLAIIILLSLPLSVKLFVYSNLIENSNFVCVKLFGIFYICRKINIQKGQLILTSPNGKKTKLRIKMLPKFVNLFFMETIKSLGIDYLITSAEIGVGDDAFKTAFWSSVAINLLNEIKVFFSIKKNLIIYYKLRTNYNEDKLTLTLMTKIYFSVLDLFFAFVKAVLNSLGEKNGKKQQPDQ